MMEDEESPTYLWMCARVFEIGEAEGRRMGLRKCILKIGTARFGPPSSADAVATTLTSDAERLNKSLDETLEASDWPDLFARCGIHSA